MQGQNLPCLRPFVLFLRFLSQISVSHSDWAATASFQIRSNSSQINQPVSHLHCTQHCAVHRQLHYTRCETANHGRFCSWKFCCLVAGVLNDVSNRLGMKEWRIVLHLLERVRSQTQLRQLRCFNDYTRQLHVSAHTGHLPVVFKRT